MSSCISFSSDCDLMTRRGFEEIHGFLDSIGLPAGDSFWLFDPSGGDMGLFTHDVDHFGPQHHWLLDQINAGVIDVIHSAGSFGERFNNGFKPRRDQIEKALSYLDKYAQIPKIWTNHGDILNLQNIGGVVPASHHQGDLPGADAYCLDLLLAAGVKYFWLDRLIWRNYERPYALTACEICRDGNEIVTFMRYLSPSISWSPNGQNFALQLQLPELKRLSDNAQDTVIYTHWGCHHEGHTAHAPFQEALTAESRGALLMFVHHLDNLGISVMRLSDLLDRNQQSCTVEQIERIGKIVVQSEKDKPDCFYYNQYSKHGLEYFRRRLAGMGVSGSRALDAGCGVGQWSFALAELFDGVCGIEKNPDALKYLGQMSEGLRSSSTPEFREGSIESLPYADGEFDFILCYGVLFCTSFRRSLNEFFRVLKQGGRAYICINGDGWYEYLIDERFCDKSDDFLLPLAEPIWNAYIARVGGESRFEQLLLDNQSLLKSDSFCTNPIEVRALFSRLLAATSFEQAELIQEYSDRVILLLAELTRRHLFAKGKLVATPFLSKLTSVLFRKVETMLNTGASFYLPLDGVGSKNRAVTPREFAVMAQLCGFRMMEHGGDGSLCLDSSVPPIYASTFNGHDSVWECYLAKE